MTAVAFVDTETTGLDPDRHDLWEVAIIIADHDPVAGVVNEVEQTWYLRPDLAKADPTGLRIGRFYERVVLEAEAWKLRSGEGQWSPPHLAARSIATTLDGRHMVGAVPSFDAAFLERFLRRNGQCPTWHYHLIDVEALAAGALHNFARNIDDGRASVMASAHDVERQRAAARPPWNSNELSRRVGVDPQQFDRHTAMGDARWAKAIYEAVYR